MCVFGGLPHLAHDERERGRETEIERESLCASVKARVTSHPRARVFRSPVSLGFPSAPAPSLRACCCCCRCLRMCCCSSSGFFRVWCASCVPKILSVNQTTGAVVSLSSGEPVRCCTPCTRVLDQQLTRALQVRFRGAARNPMLFRRSMMSLMMSVVVYRWVGIKGGGLERMQPPPVLIRAPVNGVVASNRYIPRARSATVENVAGKVYLF